MKLLVLLPGTPLTDSTAKGKEWLELDTLTEGVQKFWKTELLNNLQSVRALEATGNIAVTIKSFSRRKSAGELMKAGKAIRQYTQQEKPDAVYVFWGGPSAWVVTKFSAVPVVVCLLGSDLMGSYKVDGTKTTFGKILSAFSKMACRKANAVVVMSEKMKALLPSAVQQKTLALPEGVNLQKFYPKDKLECRRKLGWDENLPVLLFFSGSAYVKNVPLAHKVFSLVQQKLPQAKLIEVKNVPHAQLIDYYNAADLLLLTSFHEGSNNSIKEALACNCPVVCTNAGDADQRLQGVKNSFCVDSYEADLLAEKALAILSSGERSDGRKQAEQVSVERVAERLRLFLDELLNA